MRVERTYEDDGTDVFSRVTPVVGLPDFNVHAARTRRVPIVPHAPPSRATLPMIVAPPPPPHIDYSDPPDPDRPSSYRQGSEASLEGTRARRVLARLLFAGVLAGVLSLLWFEASVLLEGATADALPDALRALLP